MTAGGRMPRLRLSHSVPMSAGLDVALEQHGNITPVLQVCDILVVKKHTSIECVST